MTCTDKEWELGLQAVRGTGWQLGTTTSGDGRLVIGISYGRKNYNGDKEVITKVPKLLLIVAKMYPHT